MPDETWVIETPYPTPEENITVLLELLKSVLREPTLCPISANPYYAEDWPGTEGIKKATFMHRVISDLQTWTRIFSVKPSAVFWLLYFEREDLKFVPFHRVSVSGLTIVTEEDYKDVPITIRGTTNGEQDVKESPDTLEINIDDNIYTISPIENLFTWVLYDYKNAKVTLPKIPQSADYTARDFRRAMSAMQDLISVTDPELGKLVNSPGSADSLILEMMAYLHDRLNLYIDMSNASWDPRNARGVQLEVLSRYLGYEPVPPLPATFSAAVVLTPDFLVKVRDQLYKDAQKDNKYTILRGETDRLDPESRPKIQITDTNYVSADIPTTLELGNYTFNLKDSIKTLSWSLISSRELPFDANALVLRYREGTAQTEEVSVDMRRTRTLMLRNDPVDPDSVTITEVGGSDLNFTIIKTPKEYLTALQNSFKEETWKTIPVYLSVSKEGIARLIFLPTPRQAIETTSIRIDYKTHSKDVANGLSVQDFVKIPLYLTRPTFTITSSIFSPTTITLDDWPSTTPFAFVYIYPSWLSEGGYSGDTDDDIRGILLEYGDLTRVKSLMPYGLSKRGVLEEDLSILLLNYPNIKMLKVKVEPYGMPLMVSSPREAIEEEIE